MGKVIIRFRFLNRFIIAEFSDVICDWQLESQAKVQGYYFFCPNSQLEGVVGGHGKFKCPKLYAF